MKKKNQVPAKYELQRLKNSNLEILRPENQLSLRDCEQEEIKMPLRFVMILLGIKGENVPEGIEVNVMTEHLKYHYPDYSPGEIKYAFGNAMARKYRGVDVAAYQTFSVEYIGKIIYAYSKWQPNTGPEYGWCSVGHEKVKQGVNQAYKRFSKEDRFEEYPNIFYSQMVHDKFIEKISGPAQCRYYPKLITILNGFVKYRQEGRNELYKAEEEEDENEENI